MDQDKKDAFLRQMREIKNSELLNYYKKSNFFKDKNIIVTGATGGIGSLVVGSLIQMGAKVIAIAKDERKVTEMFESEIKQKNKNFDYEIINLDSPMFINKGFRNIMLKKFNGKLDGLILCHGIFSAGKLSETLVDAFDATLNTNVRSCFHLISLSTPFLKLTKGNCVALSSIYGKLLYKDSFLESLSNAMLNSLIECSALELASFGVRVNGVAPGMTYTDYRVSNVFSKKESNQYIDAFKSLFLLNNQPIQAPDVVSSILYLLSDDASFVTGEILTVDNGFSLSHDFEEGK